QNQEEGMLLHSGTGHPATPDLIKGLKEPNRLARLRAAATLCRQARTDQGVVAALLTALKQGDEQARKTAALVLGEIGPHARAAVPALIETLADDCEAVKRRAVMTLGELGADACAAIPALLALTCSANENLQTLAALACKKSVHHQARSEKRPDQASARIPSCSYGSLVFWPSRSAQNPATGSNLPAHRGWTFRSPSPRCIPIDHPATVCNKRPTLRRRNEIRGE